MDGGPGIGRAGIQTCASGRAPRRATELLHGERWVARVEEEHVGAPFVAPRFLERLGPGHVHDLDETDPGKLPAEHSGRLALPRRRAARC